MIFKNKCYIHIAYIASILDLYTYMATGYTYTYTTMVKIELLHQMHRCKDFSVSG